MKKRISLVAFVLFGMCCCAKLLATPAAIQSHLTTENELIKINNPSKHEKQSAIEKRTENQQEKLNTKIRKFEKRLKKQHKKFKNGESINDVFGDRYFILGTVFVLSGLALAVLGSITSIGLFGWLGGIAVIVGLVLIIVALLQTV